MNEWQNFSQAWATLIDVVLTYGIRFLLSLAIISAGYLAARLLDTLTIGLVRRTGLETLLEKLDLSELLYRVGIRTGIATVLGRLTRIIVITASAFVAIDVAGIEAFSSFRDQFFAFVPRGLTALALLILGFVLAEFARVLTVATVSSSDLFNSPELIGKFVQILVVVIAIATASEHLGLEIQLIRQVLLLVFATAGLSLAIGLGFGGQRVLRNLLSRVYVEQALALGSTVVLNDTNLGELKAFATQSVVFEDREGHETWIPYSEFISQKFRVLIISDFPPVADPDI